MELGPIQTSCPRDPCPYVRSTFVPAPNQEACSSGWQPPVTRPWTRPCNPKVRKRARVCDYGNLVANRQAQHPLFSYLFSWAQLAVKLTVFKSIFEPNFLTSRVCFLCHNLAMGVIKTAEWRKLPLSLTELCIDTTLRCGQSFRWRKLNDEWYDDTYCFHLVLHQLTSSSGTAPTTAGSCP